MTPDLTFGLLGWLRGASVGALLSLRVDTTPSPTHRPRVAKAGWTYYAKSYQVYHADCVKQFAKQGGLSHNGPVACVVETICQRPKSTKLSAPRGDSDNYAKAPLDAATKAGVWGDDAQVIPLASTRRWTEPGEEPGVILHIGRLG